MEEQISVAQSGKSTLRNVEIENYIVVPPDGGWGWVVIGAAYFSNLVADGMIYTFGLFLEELSKSFHVTIGNVTIVGSIMSFFYYSIGPFVSALLNRFGFRFVGILGGVIAATGVAAASICDNFITFTICGGIVTGVGLGMITISSVIVVGYYFERWRALGTGIATCGSGTGTLVMPPLVTFLLKKFSWNNTYRILACILLTAAFAAILYRPLIPIKVVQDEKELKIIQQTESSVSIKSETTRCCSCRFWKHHNIFYPTAADVIPVESVLLEAPDWSEEISTISYDSNVTDAIVTDRDSSTTTIENNDLDQTTESSTVENEKCCQKCWRKILKLVCCGHFQTISRPMYRDDIFFAHSLMLLPQYKESLAMKPRVATIMSKSVGYHMSVTRVTTHREIHKKMEYERCMCPLAVLRTLSTMLDLRLLRSPAFQMLSWSGMFVAFAYFVPFLYIKDRAIKSGIPSDTAFWLLSTIGAANTAGRIISGILPSVTNLKVIQYSYVCIMVAGAFTIASGWWMHIGFQFFYAFLYGLSGSLRPVIVVELFGLEHLTNAYGLQLMFMGFAAFAGTLTAGLVYDATQDYNNSFYISGSCLISSALLLIFIKQVRAYEKAHNCSGDI